MKVHLVNEVAGTIAAIAKDLGEQAVMGPRGDDQTDSIEKPSELRLDQLYFKNKKRTDNLQCITSMLKDDAGSSGILTKNL